MTSLALDRETSNYWNFIKDASNKSKLMLLTLISASISGDEIITTKRKSSKARRLNAMTDNQMEQEMEGEPTPIMDSEDVPIEDIITANKGRIVKGLEKWL